MFAAETIYESDAIAGPFGCGFAGDRQIENNATLTVAQGRLMTRPISASHTDYSKKNSGRVTRSISSKPTWNTCSSSGETR